MCLLYGFIVIPNSLFIRRVQTQLDFVGETTNLPQFSFLTLLVVGFSYSISMLYSMPMLLLERQREGNDALPFRDCYTASSVNTSFSLPRFIHFYTGHSISCLTFHGLLYDCFFISFSGFLSWFNLVPLRARGFVFRFRLCTFCTF